MYKLCVLNLYVFLCMKVIFYGDFFDGRWKYICNVCMFFLSMYIFLGCDYECLI